MPKVKLLKGLTFNINQDFRNVDSERIAAIIKDELQRCVKRVKERSDSYSITKRCAITA